MSTSCELIYALHVPDSSPKLVTRRRLIPVDKYRVVVGGGSDGPLPSRAVEKV